MSEKGKGFYIISRYTGKAPENISSLLQSSQIVSARPIALSSWASPGEAPGSCFT